MQTPKSYLLNLRLAFANREEALQHRTALKAALMAALQTHPELVERFLVHAFGKADKESGY